MNSVRNIISILLKLTVVVCAFWGIGIAIFGGDDTLLHNARTFVFFTTQSNLWIGIVCLVGLVLKLCGKTLTRNLAIIKLVFTVSITLTGIVFCFILVPANHYPFDLPNVLVHVIVPLAALLDFFVTKYEYQFKYRDGWWSAIPPIWYLAFASFGYIHNWTFGYVAGAPKNYPYFFLNWGSELGAFGLSAEAPFLGTFYWIIVLIAFVVAFSVIDICIVRKLNKD